MYRRPPGPTPTGASGRASPKASGGDSAIKSPHAPIVAGKWKGETGGTRAPFLLVRRLCEIAAPVLCHEVTLAIIPESQEFAEIFCLRPADFAPGLTQWWRRG